MDGDTVVLIPPSSSVDEAAALIKKREEESAILIDKDWKGKRCAMLICFPIVILFYVSLSAFFEQPDVQKDTLQQPYSLEKTDYYQCSLMTKEYGIEFYVDSSDGFNETYPLGTLARDVIENTIITDYVDTIQAYCKYELSKFIRRPDFPTTPFFCSKLESLGRKT